MNVIFRSSNANCQCKVVWNSHFSTHHTNCGIYKPAFGEPVCGQLQVWFGKHEPRTICWYSCFMFRHKRDIYHGKWQCTKGICETSDNWATDTVWNNHIDWWNRKLSTRHPGRSDCQAWEEDQINSCTALQIFRRVKTMVVCSIPDTSGSGKLLGLQGRRNLQLCHIPHHVFDCAFCSRSWESSEHLFRLCERHRQQEERWQDPGGSVAAPKWRGHYGRDILLLWLHWFRFTHSDLTSQNGALSTDLLRRFVKQLSVYRRTGPEVHCTWRFGDFYDVWTRHSAVCLPLARRRLVVDSPVVRSAPRLEYSCHFAQQQYQRHDYWQRSGNCNTGHSYWRNSLCTCLWVAVVCAVCHLHRLWMSLLQMVSFASACGRTGLQHRKRIQTGTTPESSVESRQIEFAHGFTVCWGLFLDSSFFSAEIFVTVLVDVLQVNERTTSSSCGCNKDGFMFVTVSLLKGTLQMSTIAQDWFVVC